MIAVEPVGRPARALLALLTLASLGACNMIVTTSPLFEKADTAGAPQLRPGLWSQAGPGGEPCNYDPKTPLKAWPECARGFLIKPGEMGGYDTKDGKQVWTSAEILLAQGDPEVLQLHVTRQNDPDEAADGGPESAYVYIAIHPTETDHGEIIGYTSWPARCGPPPPADAVKPDGNARYGTLTPMPGLTMDAKLENCTTTSQDAVRASAKASQPWTPPDDIIPSHWVRAGEE
ncbi:MAG TPA: hypothetical protein VGI95_17360 [Caulobacteraceae bacterium]